MIEQAALKSEVVTSTTSVMEHTLFRTVGLSVHSGARPILRDISCSIQAGTVFGILGPSGAGKSTLLKCLNRLIDLTPSLSVSGDITFHGQSIFGPAVDVDALRARVGMIFQQPVVFPVSIQRNVVFGLRHLQKLSKAELSLRAEKALREASLWNEVKDRLSEPAQRLSVGQQQRLCLARTLALDPEAILMDEPTSALDPKSTEALEELILTLTPARTVVLVTHNMAQADRVCDFRLEIPVLTE